MRKVCGKCVESVRKVCGKCKMLRKVCGKCAESVRNIRKENQNVAENVFSSYMHECILFFLIIKSYNSVYIFKKEKNHVQIYKKKDNLRMVGAIRQGF